jgi:pilus assembly protein FimV
LDESKQGDMKAQVEGRLDVLFSEVQSAPENQANQGDSPESPLKPLKAILLAVDWEITDETLASLLREVKRLEEIYSEEKIPLTLLQILSSIGKYVRLNKGKAHPATIKLINSAYLALERTVTTQGIPQQEKQRLLLTEVAKFKKLKEEIAVRRESREEEDSDEVVTPRFTELSSSPAEVEERSPGRAVSQIAPQEAFAIAVEEIKDLIRAEFKVLRAEIRLWRNSK